MIHFDTKNISFEKLLKLFLYFLSDFGRYTVFVQLREQKLCIRLTCSNLRARIMSQLWIKWVFLVEKHAFKNAQFIIVARRLREKVYQEKSNKNIFIGISENYIFCIKKYHSYFLKKLKTKKLLKNTKKIKNNKK